jgi:hypothetical protein
MAEPSTDQGTNTSAEPSGPQRGSGFATWLLWFLIFLLFYTLSVGPALKVYDRYPATQTAIEFFYIPLDFLDHHCPGAHRFFKWYINQVWKA